MMIMKGLRMVAVMALVASPAFAQAPAFNLMPELTSKTPEEKEREELQQKAYRDSLRKIPDSKAANDPWGSVRSEAPAKTAKPKGKTGSAVN